MMTCIAYIFDRLKLEYFDEECLFISTLFALKKPIRGFFEQRRK